MTDTGPAHDLHGRLLALLDANQAVYRVLAHAPEGRTELVSALRGHPVAAAAKCLVLIVRPGKRHREYVLAVVPGDARVSFGAIRALKEARYVAFAEPGLAESLAGSPPGTVLPFAFDPRLELIADPAVASRPVIYFNAGRLDRSLELRVADWLRIAAPRLEGIVEAGARTG